MRISLRYRIAAVVFVFTGALAVILLRQVQTAQEELAAAQLAAAEATISDLLAEVGRLAVVRSEYGDLQQLFEKVRQNAQVRTIAVADADGRVVASTDAALLGKSLPPLRDGELTAWRTRELVNAAGRQGLLALEVSRAQLVQARREARRRGVAVGLAGTTLIALLSVLMGTALTRRLALLEQASRRIGEGDYGVRTHLQGADEVSTLGRALDAMAARIELDATERRRAEERLSHLNRLYALLSNANQAIVRTRDRQALMDQICRVAVEDGKFRMAWIGLADREANLVRIVARHGYLGEYVDGLHLPLEGDSARDGPTATAIRQGRHVVCNDIQVDPLMAPWREQALAHGHRSMASLPLLVLGKTIGTFNLYSAEVGFFSEGEMGLLDELAADVAYAFEHLEREAEQQKLVSILDSSSDFIALADAGGRVLYLNPAGRALVGVADDDPLRGTSIPDFAAAADVATLRDRLALGGPGGGKWTGGLRLRHFTTGEEIPVEVTSFAVLDRRTHRPIALAAICRDVRERQRAERALRRSEEQYRLVVENASEAIFIAQDGRLKFPNAAVLKLLELPASEVGARPFTEFIHADEREMVAERHGRRLRGEDVPSVYEFRVTTASGKTRWVQLSAVRIDWEGRPATLNFLTDVTGKKALEAQLLHAQKMEAVGRLAGGVAHDFNNLLAAIMGYGSAALAELPAQGQVRDDLQQILVAANRAAELTRSLLAYSRRQASHPQPVNLDAVIGRVQGLLRRVIGEDVALRMALGAPEATVLADSGQVEQLLMNLATNSRDAMPNGGQLSLETRPTPIGDEFIRQHGYGKRGAYVLVTVSDTGQGMDEETRRRAFEPFFTTKEVGRGTGLGLASVYGIVKQHGGFIALDSSPGQGATFRIYLPVVEGAPRPLSAAGREAEPRGGGETVLVAEDDPAVRSLTCRELQAAGYAVVAAQDGQEAIELLGQHGERVDLLIVDVVMPRRNGKEVVEQARRLRPTVKVLYTSGYPADTIPVRTILEEGLSFLAKPAAPGDLLRKVREVLDR